MIAVDVVLALAAAGMAPQPGVPAEPPLVQIPAPPAGDAGPLASTPQPSETALPDSAETSAPAPQSSEAPNQSLSETAGSPAPTTVDAEDPALLDARIAGEADPLAPINRLSYAITQPIDRFILRPAAMAYKTVVPHPLRDGARNAIRNLNDPLIVFNDLLQLRPDRAIRSTIRFLLNSTLGLGGLFDVARRKPFHIPHHANSFADTLGYYGVKPLLYLYLPVLGPTTLRDIGGEFVDDLAHPRLLYKIAHPDSDKPIWRARTNLGKVGTVIRVVGGLDQRAEADDDLRRFREDSIDPYAALRASFLQDRAGEIAALRTKDGAAPASTQLDDPLTDPAAGR